MTFKSDVKYLNLAPNKNVRTAVPNLSGGVAVNKHPGYASHGGSVFAAAQFCCGCFQLDHVVSEI